MQKTLSKFKQYPIPKNIMETNKLFNSPFTPAEQRMLSFAVEKIDKLVLEDPEEGEDPEKQKDEEMTAMRKKMEEMVGAINSENDPELRKRLKEVYVEFKTQYDAMRQNLSQVRYARRMVRTRCGCRYEYVPIKKGRRDFVPLINEYVRKINTERYIKQLNKYIKKMKDLVSLDDDGDLGRIYKEFSKNFNARKKELVSHGLDKTNRNLYYSELLQVYETARKHFFDRVDLLRHKKENEREMDEIKGEIKQEKLEREKGDAALGTRIDDENKAREEGDKALGTRIDDEKSAREEAVETLTNNLDDLNRQLAEQRESLKTMNSAIDTVKREAKEHADNKIAAAKKEMSDKLDEANKANAKEIVDLKKKITALEEMDAERQNALIEMKREIEMTFSDTIKNLSDTVTTLQNNLEAETEARGESDEDLERLRQDLAATREELEEEKTAREKIEKENARIKSNFEEGKKYIIDKLHGEPTKEGRWHFFTNVKGTTDDVMLSYDPINGKWMWREQDADYYYLPLEEGIYKTHEAMKYDWEKAEIKEVRDTILKPLEKIEDESYREFR